MKRPARITLQEVDCMAEKLLDNVTDELKNDIAKLRDDFKGLGDDVKKLLELKTAWAGKVGTTIGHEASDAWADVQKKLKIARSRGEKAVDDVTLQIEDHPWGSILAAAGVGVIIGLLIHRRSR